MVGRWRLDGGLACGVAKSNIDVQLSRSRSCQATRAARHAASGSECACRPASRAGQRHPFASGVTKSLPIWCSSTACASAIRGGGHDGCGRIPAGTARRATNESGGHRRTGDAARNPAYGDHLRRFGAVSRPGRRDDGWPLSCPTHRRQRRPAAGRNHGKRPQPDSSLTLIPESVVS